MTQQLIGKTWLSILLCLLITIHYPKLVAVIVPNTIPMPAMDQATYITSDKSVVNYMNFSTYDSERIDLIETRIIEMVKKHRKFRYKVKYICGDPYYEEMPVDEAIKKIVLRPKDEEHMCRS